MEISPEIRSNRSFLIAAIIQLGYSAIEILDSFCIPLIAIGVLPNVYLSFGFTNPEIAWIFENQPALFIPIFWFFASCRLLSGIWILQNKAKGFWLGILVSCITLVDMFFFLPLGALDCLFTWPVIILLILSFMSFRRPFQYRFTIVN
ncbi:MAG: hypothetical protein ACW97A_11490 [Candidatus Thorarchaeota archaeon]